MKFDHELLEHIHVECDFIIKNTKNITFEKFENDEILKRAIVRSLSIIGEATKKISAITKNKSDTIEWRDLMKTRDILTHQYFGIDYEIIWNIVSVHIPVLQKKIVKLLESTK